MHFSVLFTHCPACGSVRFIQNNEKSKRCESCGFVFYMNASAAVAAFIVNSQGELLVCVRGKNPAKGTWDLPGGFVDDNETAEEAMCREIEEELRAQVVEAKYLFSLPNKYEYSGLQIPTLDMFFACKLEDISNLQPSDDVADCFFVPMDEVNPELFGLESIKKAVGMFINKNPQAPKGELD
ncbi:NUDIX hydrolase [Paludibacter propionicigenes WB4]|uniref:NUDIX hydrolase n=1 Tax=Paludibacter propionicigenes (strain DSM 17365 / JCM 13257 / WB4) TaxID=694427 RepID=E4T889_PALPW|nr:NUDIX domain-containing protein [Paludibacter propionicigenes]ADQ80933.1 NUDIX hydrolase [Paludibacter propionicigenes WB4]